MSVDPERVAAMIAEIAESEMMPRFGRLNPDDVRRKSGPSDLVTEVDERTEVALKKALASVLPNAAFIGEETLAANPRAWRELSGSDAYWVVDPLDGTRNFVKGEQEFGTIVALVVGGETVAGWIYAAPQRRCAWAIRGEGASIDGKPIATDRRPREKPIAFRALGWLEPRDADRLRAILATRCVSKSNHCSAYAYLKLAQGEADLQLSSRMHPWDHLAGALILDQLGGRTAFLDDGAPLRPQPSVDRLHLAVAPGRDWETFAAALR